MPDKSPSADFGPTPETEIRISNISFSAALKNPNNEIESSFTFV